MARSFLLLLLLLPMLIAQSTSPATPPDLRRLVTQLASDDFATRTAAQKDLSTLSWRHRDLLAKAHDAASDPEVKSAFAAHLAAIDEQLALCPTPFTLHLKDAPADEITRTLLRQAERVPFTLRIAPRVGQANVDADDASLPDVLAQLHAQNPLEVVVGRNGCTVLGGIPSRHIAFAPGAILTLQSFTGLGGPGNNLATDGECTLTIDPRVRLVDAEFKLVQVTDAQGKEIPRTLSRLPFGFVPAASARCSFSLPVAGVPSQPLLLSTLQLAATFTVVTAQEERVIDDLSSQLNNPLTLHSPNPFTFTTVESTPKTLTLQFTRAYSREAAQAAVARGDARSTDDFLLVGRLTDRKGRQADNLLDAPHRMVFSDPGNSYELPFKLTLIHPTKTYRYTRTFTFKNITLGN